MKINGGEGVRFRAQVVLLEQLRRYSEEEKVVGDREADFGMQSKRQKRENQRG